MNEAKAWVVGKILTISDEFCRVESFSEVSTLGVDNEPAPINQPKTLNTL